MINYTDLEHLRKYFIQGEVTFPPRIIVDGVIFDAPLTRESINLIKHTNHQTIIKYHNEDSSTLAFSWRITEGYSLIPHSVDIWDNSLVEQTNISYHENIVLYGFNQNQPIKSKVDTGADMCSLHATDIQTSNNTVSFTYNNRQYQMNVGGSIDIQQADSTGDNSRPVVKFNVTIGDVNIPNVEFNLNDRSSMDGDILIGKNLLDKHDFNIRTAAVLEWTELDHKIPH